MNYYLVKNLLMENGTCDYKGLDVDLIVKGTQIYPYNLSINNKCLIGTLEDIQERNLELIKITEEEYLNIKTELLDTFKDIETTEEKLIREKAELENQLLIEKDKQIGGIL